jgi:hypothetical protein
MSHPLLLALYGNEDAAAEAARRLRALGVPREDLSIVASDHQTEGAIADEVGGTPGAEIEDSRRAGQLGELSGLFLAAIAIGLPGTGAVVAAGPLAAELGEAAGHVAGHLSSTLVKAGLSEKEAVDWQLRIHAGAVLVGVHVRSIQASAAETALQRAGAERLISAQWEENT